MTKKLFQSVLSVIQLCSVPNEEDLKQQDGGISKPFVALDHAVKEWFRRNHSLEKETKKKREKGSSWKYYGI
jgi:hypothetical protein